MAPHSTGYGQGARGAKMEAAAARGREGVQEPTCDGEGVRGGDGLAGGWRDPTEATRRARTGERRRGRAGGGVGMRGEEAGCGRVGGWGLRRFWASWFGPPVRDHARALEIDLSPQVYDSTVGMPL